MAPAFDPVVAQRHEWTRTMGGWHLAFGLLALVTVILIGVDGELSTPGRWWAMAMSAVLCAWYAWLGVPAIHEQGSRRGLVYLAAAIPLTIGLFAVTAMGAIMLFILYPHVWAILSTRLAMVATAVAIVATGGVTVMRLDGFDGRIPGAVAIIVVGMVVSLALGLWITRIINQSSRRADLLAELAETRAELAEAERLAGASAERERLAREIHDTLAQGFASTALLMDAALRDVGRDDGSVRDHLLRAGVIAKENLAEARDMIATLVPSALREASLPDALRQLVKRLGSPGPCVWEVDVSGTPRQLPTERETAILRVVQEALTNSRKHSGAEAVCVGLVYGPETVKVSVIDDGCGFDPDETTAGYGLPGMRQRVSLAGGRLSIGAAAGEGVSINVEFTT